MLTNKRIIIIGVLVLIVGVIWFSQTFFLKKKIEGLEKTVDTQEKTIVQLNQELKLMQFELQTVQKGLVVLENYTKREREVVSRGEETKSKILNVVEQSDESKDWWSSEIPSDLLDALLCK